MSDTMPGTTSESMAPAATRRLFGSVDAGVRTIGLVLVGLFLVVVFLDARSLGHLHTGDSDNLVQGARVLADCLERGDLVGCGHIPASVQTTVFPYPLMQYLPAMALGSIGLSNDQILTTFGVLSFMALVASLGLVLTCFRARPKVAALVVTSFVASSWLYQATSAFGESLAAALCVAAVVAAICRRPWWLFALVTLAALGKETVAPFVALLCLVCARGDDRLLPERRLLIPIVGGAMVGMTTNALFNVLRFGTVRNLNYLDPPLHTPGVGRKIEFLLGLAWSPAGGFVWFWPVASFVLVASSIIAARRLLRSPSSWRRDMPVLAVPVAFVGMLAGLSAWYSPFGWLAYGPRLVVPLIAPATLVVAHLVGDDLVALLQRRALAVAAVMLALAVGLPQFGSPWRWSVAIGQLISASGSCPPLTALDLFGDRAGFFRCLSNAMWRLRPQVLDDNLSLSWSIGGTMWLIGPVGCAALLWFARLPTAEGLSGPPPMDVQAASET